MKRVAIFASYTKNNIIPEYVIYYLRGLKKVASDIIFIADNEVQSGEEEKLKDLVVFSKCERHGCYDFGSYRRGFEWAEQNGILNNADELIFCNDSCYGPVYPFENVFAEMDKRKCDFWGMAESHELRTHLQSYFLIFKSNVFHSQNFKEYVHSFEKQDDFYGYVKNYEIKFAEHLSEAGFTYTAYLDVSKYEKENRNNPINPMIFPIMTLSDGMPLLKKKMFGCQYCAVLKDMHENVMKIVKSVNPEIYEIIAHDIKNVTTELHRPIIEEISRMRVHINNLEKIQTGQQVHINNLNQIRTGQQTHISIIEKMLSQQQDQNDYLSKKNKKHLRQIRALAVLCTMIIIVLILSLFF